MMKYWKIILVIIVALGAYGLYEYNKGPRKLNNEKADALVSAVDLFQSFESDEQSANALYLDKIIEVIMIIKKEGL